MGGIRTFATPLCAAVLAVAGIAGCTSSGNGTPAGSASSSAPASASVSSPVSTPMSTPMSSATSRSVGPPRVTQPSVPADVPTSGPNAKAGEKPPVLSLEGTQHTPEGAKAFAEFFIQTIDWGYATTSSTYMRHYFTSACIGCRSTADALDKARRQQHRFIGDRFIIGSAVVTGTPTSTSTHVLTTFDVTSVEVVDNNGKYVAASPAYSGFEELLTLGWTGSSWTVQEFAGQRK